QFVAAPGEVTDGQRQTGDKPTSKPSARAVVTGQQQIERQQNDGVENQPGDHFKNNRTSFWGERAASNQPLIPPHRREPAYSLGFFLFHKRRFSVSAHR